jgi:hypothetical protein
MELQEIQRVFDIGLPIVQELRRNSDYVEKDVYENFSEDHKEQRLTSGPLAGSRGLGLQVGCPRWRLQCCPIMQMPNLSNYRTSGSRLI